MKAGMKPLNKTQVNNYWVWLCTDSEQKWATYISISPSEDCTEYGHYFLTQSTAVNDFNNRVKQFSKPPAV